MTSQGSSSRTLPTDAVDSGLAVPGALRGLGLAGSVELRATGRTQAADVLPSLLERTWRTCVRRRPPRRPEVSGVPDVFVVTGDIPAMWLRDAAGQLRPYLAAGADPEVADVLVGASRTMTALVLVDPYANSFNDGPTDTHPDPSDEPRPRPEVWERKYEVDSLASHLTFAYEVWRATGRTDHLDADFAEAAATVLDVWSVETDHPRSSAYRFWRREGAFADDTLPDDGRGAPVAPTGMTWSGFRPSDDRCELGYLVPANAAAVVALEGLAELAALHVVPAALGERAAPLAALIADGIVDHGLVDLPGLDGPVYAYEVDGLGGHVVMDDANVPSLLALPYLGWTDADDPVYLRTRELVLGPRNPYWYSGSQAAGVGSPHTPPRHVWPIALAVQALTAADDEEAGACADLLLAAWSAEPGMCESFHVDDPRRFTRNWFCWADSLVAEALLRVAGRPVPRLLPSRLSGVAAAQKRAGLNPPRASMHDRTTDRRWRAW